MLVVPFTHDKEADGAGCHVLLVLHLSGQGTLSDPADVSQHCSLSIKISAVRRFIVIVLKMRKIRLSERFLA